MFANNTQTIDFGAPDTVLAPPLSQPTPMVNNAFSSAAVPSQTNITVGGGLVENSATEGTVSVGDQAGAGVASGINSGPDQAITFSAKSFMGGMATTHMTSQQNQNLNNLVGSSLTPGQTKVLILA